MSQPLQSRIWTEIGKQWVVITGCSISASLGQLWLRLLIQASLMQRYYAILGELWIKLILRAQQKLFHLQSSHNHINWTYLSDSISDYWCQQQQNTWMFDDTVYITKLLTSWLDYKHNTGLAYLVNFIKTWSNQFIHSMLIYVTCLWQIVLKHNWLQNVCSKIDMTSRKMTGRDVSSHPGQTRWLPPIGARYCNIAFINVNVRRYTSY